MSWKISLQVIGLCFGLLVSASAQDFHYSQFYNNPLHLNPALTGVFNGDIRIQGNYRNQWSNVPVDYKTFSLVADKKFQNRTDRSGVWAAGLGLNYDRSGDSRLTWLDLNLQGAYTHYLGDGFFVTLGGQLAYGNRAFQQDELRWSTGYQPGQGRFIPGLPSGENFGNTSHGFFDISTGVNFRFQALSDIALFDFKEKRTKVDVGVGFWHLNRPDQSFVEDEKVPLDVRISPYAQGVVQLSSSVDFVLAFTAQFQGPYSEKVGMLGGRVHLNRNPGKQIALQLGFGYRFEDFGDAWYPMFQLDYNNIRVGLSYDVNISDFNIATERNGGPEVSARYIFKKVKPLPSRKFCPLI